MNFMKNLFLGSVFALGSIGLTACGDDSSSAGDGDSSSSAEELVLSSVSETSPLADFSEIKADVTTGDNGGFALTLSGSIATESDAFETPGYDGDPITYQVDSLSFDVGRKENGKEIRVGNLPVPVRSTFKFPKEQFNLAIAIDKVPLDQDSIGCGDFVLYVTIYMSGDKEETKQYAFTARLEADFSLDCKPAEVSSSSVAEVCTQVDSVAVEFSNEYNKITAKQAINFATGAAENPHVTMSLEGGVGYLVAASGVTFQQIDSYDNSSGMWSAPASPACLEKFSYSPRFDDEGNSATKVKMQESTQWYMVITADGNFPIRPTGVLVNGSEGSISFIYYKKTN